MKSKLITAAAALFMLACNKKDSVPAPDASNALVKMVTSSLSTTNYQYDATGRAIKYTNSDGSYVEYVYTSNMVTEKVYKPNGDLNYSYFYELDAAGRCVKTTISNNANYIINDTYNSQGFIVKSISHINGSNQGIDYFYSNGNLDSTRFTDNGGNWSLTIVKTYYADKPNVLANKNWGTNFYGTDNKNLLKSEQYIYANGGALDPTSYVYETDGLGRVVKQTSTKGANIHIQLYSY